MPTAPDDYVLIETATSLYLKTISPKVTTNDLYQAYGFATHTAAQKAITDYNLRGTTVGTRPHP